MLDTIAHNHTPTSIAAANRIRACAENMRETVLHAVEQAGKNGLTRDEVANVTGLKANTVRPRVCELIARAKLTEQGKRDGCKVLVAS
jgi:DNA-directed RNA polymerase specialized sigma24 family protein